MRSCCCFTESTMNRPFTYCQLLIALGGLCNQTNNEVAVSVLAKLKDLHLRYSTQRQLLCADEFASLNRR